MNLTAAQFKALKKPRNKYNAVKTVVDGIAFASKAEAEYYRRLKDWQQAGLISYFLIQVPFRLPGNTKYVVDFQIFGPELDVAYLDVKGFDTPIGKLKRKQVEALYPVKIAVIKLVRSVFVEV